jgi:hypothetical protein
MKDIDVLFFALFLIIGILLTCSYLWGINTAKHKFLTNDFYIQNEEIWCK